LEEWFATKEKVAVAFSGGVDSSLLFFVGSRVLSSNCRGFLAQSPLVASHQIQAARDFAGHYNLALEESEFSPFQLKGFADNNSDRCYICKKGLYEYFRTLLAPGWHLADGTNLDDNPDERPGFQALTELGIATPFLDCGINKKQIRDLSRSLGLSTWDKPSDSCLATRIPGHISLTGKGLQKVEDVEAALRALGFEGMRAHLQGDAILLTFREGDFERAATLEMRNNIQKKMTEFNFSKVFLDLSERPGILP
jgi:uncharacterized protein